MCVAGHYCLDEYQVPKQVEYLTAYNAELDKIRARNGGAPLQDFQYAEAMLAACGMGRTSNCSSSAYTDLQSAYSAKAVAAKEAAHGVSAA